MVRVIRERHQRLAVFEGELDRHAPVGARDPLGAVEQGRTPIGDPVGHAVNRRFRIAGQVGDAALAAADGEIEHQPPAVEARAPCLEGAHAPPPLEGAGVEIAAVGKVPDHGRPLRPAW